MWRALEFSVHFTANDKCVLLKLQNQSWESMNYKYCIGLGAVILQVEVKLWALACLLVIDSCENDR